jgi:hypothetical protein
MEPFTAADIRACTSPEGVAGAADPTFTIYHLI